jgi:hypothetical protein
MADLLDVLRIVTARLDLAGVPYMVSGSDLQLRDAASLVASVPDLDWPYTNRWAATLGVARELEALKP